MFIIRLDPAGLDCLIITGGDDGALAITRRLQSKASVQPTTSTLLIPKAHAAAINAVEYLHEIAHAVDKPLRTHVFVSSGNDQRLKTWVVQVKDPGIPGNPIEAIAVRLYCNQYASVADASSLSSIITAKGAGVVVAGIGMECFEDSTSGILPFNR